MKVFQEGSFQFVAKNNSGSFNNSDSVEDFGDSDHLDSNDLLFI